MTQRENRCGTGRTTLVRRTRAVEALVAAVTVAATAVAATPRAAGADVLTPEAVRNLKDKQRRTVFDPTPREHMREFSTDRPDVTESPYTVDAGHFQLEMSFVEYAYDDDGDATLNEFSIVPSNFKLGLLNNVDLQLVVDPYIHQRV